jgi:hypothetical protein
LLWNKWQLCVGTDGKFHRNPQVKPFAFRVDFLLNSTLNPMAQAVMGFFFAPGSENSKKNPPGLAEWGIAINLQRV